MQKTTTTTKAKVTACQGTFTFSSEISLLVNTSTDTDTEVFWINLLYNISQYNVPSLKHELCNRDKERDRAFSFLQTSSHAGLLIEYYINVDVWFHSTFQNKGKILLTFSHIMGRKKPYRVHSSLHNRKGMGSRLKKVLSKDEKKRNPIFYQASRSLMSFGYCRYS